MLTNLDSEEFPPELLKDLYHLRCGVEDAFRKLKYALSVLDVHSKKAVCVEQEVFGRMLMYNYTQRMLNYANETREASPENKREYRPSFTKGVGHARRYLNGTITCDEMLAYMKQEFEAIRPGRKKLRKMTPLCGLYQLMAQSRDLSHCRVTSYRSS